MLEIELRKVWVYYAPFLILTVGYILLNEGPLAKNDSRVVVIAIAQGWVVAWRLFNDPGGTQSFIFSRPLSRRRLFMVRWGVGISLQLLTVAIVFLVIASGARSWLQIQAGSPYQPMVKWFELSVLWPTGLFAILAYEVQVFLKLRTQTLSNRPDTLLYTLTKWLALALIGFFLLGHVSTGIIHLPGVSDQFFVRNLLIYFTAVTILATIASAHCYRYLEVDA